MHIIYIYHRSKIKEIRAAVRYQTKKRLQLTGRPYTQSTDLWSLGTSVARFMAIKTVPSLQPTQTLLSTGGLEMMFFQTKVWFSGSILVGIWNKYLEFLFFSFPTPPKFPLIRTSQSWSRIWGNHPKKWIFVPWSKIYVLMVVWNIFSIYWE